MDIVHQIREGSLCPFVLKKGEHEACLKLELSKLGFMSSERFRKITWAVSKGDLEDRSFRQSREQQKKACVLGRPDTSTKVPFHSVSVPQCCSATPHCFCGNPLFHLASFCSVTTPLLAVRSLLWSARLLFTLGPFPGR